MNLFLRDSRVLHVFVAAFAVRSRALAVCTVALRLGALRRMQVYSGSSLY